MADPICPRPTNPEQPQALFYVKATGNFGNSGNIDND